MEVYALVRPGADRYAVSRLAARPARILAADVSSYEEVARAVRGRRIDVVVHLAALVQRSGTIASREDFLRTNYSGTLNLCQASLEAGVRRLVHMSTADVHGASLRGQLIDENCGFAPSTDYEMSKASADRLVLLYANSGLETIVLRPPMIYGNPCSAFFRWLFTYAGSTLVPVLGDGVTLKHFVHIEDVVESIVLSMRRGRSGRAYVVADETPNTINKLLKIVGHVIGRKTNLIHIPLKEDLVLKIPSFLPWRLRYLMSWFYINRAYSIETARTELGYRPRVGLQEGLEDLFHEMRTKRSRLNARMATLV